MDNAEVIETDFTKPQRHILNISDVSVWLKSDAHNKYMQFIKRLNNSVKSVSNDSIDIKVSQNVNKLIEMLDLFQSWTDEYPPEDMGAQRFGNKSYKKWYGRLTSDVEDVYLKMLPEDLSSESKIELIPYLLDSFGNSTRIDYGSGHEASFLIFIFCLYQIGFLTAPDDDCSVVLRVFHRYLKLVKHLQTVYRMEPAGSRGVHAIDDFQFLPFLFGSSQLINNKYRLIPDYYLRPELVSQYQNDNLFFEAIQYINETKTGPFYEHSNQLYNISAVQTWEKINEGMFKMYEGEVLKKFPVVQHFLFGNLFSFKESEDSCGSSKALGLDSLAKGRHPTNLGIIQE